jgi:hypothetical protein
MAGADYLMVAKKQRKRPRGRDREEDKLFQGMFPVMSFLQ